MTPWTAAYQAPPSWIFQARVLEWVTIALTSIKFLIFLNLFVKEKIYRKRDLVAK